MRKHQGDQPDITDLNDLRIVVEQGKQRFSKNRIKVIAETKAIMPSSRQSVSVFRHRLISPAPKFCPTKVVHAWLKELRIS